MAMNAPSMRERKAAAAARLMSAVPTEIMGDLVDTMHDRILIDSIRPNPHQPRQRVDEESQEFHDLVGSIRQQGLIQPISLRQQRDGDYTIIAGERRWRAFGQLYNEKPAEWFEKQVIALNATSLRVRPRVQELDREDFAAMLQRVREETNIWPAPAGGNAST